MRSRTLAFLPLLPLVAILCAGCQGKRVRIGTVEWAAPRTAPITTLVTTLDTGSVTIRPAEGETFAIQADVHVAEHRVEEFRTAKLAFADHVAVLEQADGSVVVRSAHEGQADADDFELHVTLHVPGSPELRLKVDAGQASVRLPEARRFSANVDAGQIDAEFDAVPEGASVRVDAGQIRFVARKALGGIDASVSAGQIDVTLPEEFAGRIDVATDVGNVDLAKRFGIEVKHDLASQAAKGEVGQGNATALLRVSAGQIRVR